MKIRIDPMPAAKAAAVEQVNGQASASANWHRDLAHVHKRAIAALVLAGGVAPAEFLAEAVLRGISAPQLAELIASKPDSLAVRELARQRLLLQIDRAASPAEIATILSGSQG